MIEGTPIDKLWNRNLSIEFGKRGEKLKRIDGIGVSFTIEKSPLLVYFKTLIYPFVSTR
jgi:hypothetical protein